MAGTSAITRESASAPRGHPPRGSRALFLRFAARADGELFACRHLRERPARLSKPRASLAAAIARSTHPVAHKLPRRSRAEHDPCSRSRPRTRPAALSSAAHVEAGYPADAVAVVTGAREASSRRCSPAKQDHNVHRRRRVGQLQSRSGGGYRRVVLELGGNDPLLVLRDAILEAARLAVRKQHSGARRCKRIVPDGPPKRCAEPRRVHVCDALDPARKPSMSALVDKEGGGRPLSSGTKHRVATGRAASPRHTEMAGFFFLRAVLERGGRGEAELCAAAGASARRCRS